MKLEGVLIDECLSRIVYERLRNIYSPAYPVEYVTDTQIGECDWNLHFYAKERGMIILTRDKGFNELSDRTLYTDGLSLRQIEKKLEAIL